MAKEQVMQKQEPVEEERILEGWAKVIESYQPTVLDEQIRAHFEKAQLAEQQAQKTPFVLGEPIRCNF